MKPSHDLRSASPRPTLRYVPRQRSLAAVLAVSVFLSGCTGFLNTYLRTEKLDADIVIPAVKPGESPKAELFAGGMSSAIDAANEQRLLYFTAVSSKATTSDAIGTGLIALSALTIYKGITTNSESAKRLLGLGGVTAGGLYAYNTYYSNKEADGVYLSGFRAISCAMLRARPILFEKAEYKLFTDGVSDLGKKIESVGNDLDKIAIHRGMELDHERERLIKDAKKALKGSTDEKKIKAALKIPRFNKRLVDVRIDAGYEALARARALLRNAQLLEQRIDTSGFNLRRRVDLIAAAVNEELSRVDKDIPKLDGLLAGIGQAGVNFKAVKPDSTFTTSTEKSESPLASSFSVYSDADISEINQPEQKGAAQSSSKGRDPLAPESGVITAQILSDLAAKVNHLYAKQRSVSKTLLSYRALGKQVTDLADCRFGSVAPLKISPDKDELVVEQGMQYQFAITGGRGIPKAWLVGGIAAEADGKKALETVVEQNQVVAKVTIPANTPKGVAYLVVTDGQGQGHEEVALVIDKDPKPKSDPPDPNTPPRKSKNQKPTPTPSPVPTAGSPVSGSPPVSAPAAPKK